MIETVPSGTVLYGRYRIERVLGSGGFGHVYLALELSTNQQYAVKEYLVSGPSGQEQLMHEANVLSHLHHPNLPAFHDAFNERGRYYVVLNYIEGTDLTDIIRITQRRNDVVPITQIMGWILATCDAVFFLHNQRPPVIHRDIKPDNIRIMPNGTAILVDLGNAKTSADGSRTLFFIRHQGTPGYAPPEQYPGGSGTDIRSDIYALGATLYFALTTQEPPSVSARNQSIQQGQPDLPSLQDQLAKNPPEDSPEVNAAKQFRLGVSKPAKPAPRHSRHLAQLGMLSPIALSQLNLIIQRAMAMRPKDRYQSIADFANDLQRVLSAIPMPTIAATNQQAAAPVNPYGTQPDLPMLYDAIQNAKVLSNQGVPDVSRLSTPVPAVTPSASTVQYYCPHCNKPVQQKSVFCPHCGLSLTNTPKSPVGTSNPSATATTGQGVSQKPITGQDVLGDQTMVVTPQVQQTLGTYSPMPTPAAASMTPLAASNGASNTPSPWDTAPVAPQNSVGSGSANITNMTQKQVMQQKSSISASPSFHIGLGLIIAVVIVLVILVLIMVLLIINAAHHAAFIQFPAVSITIYTMDSLL